MNHVDEAADQICRNEAALLAHDSGGSGLILAAGEQWGRRRGRPRRVDADADPRATAAILLIAEAFVGDMLRLEQEHGLNAREMLEYYKGERKLDEED